MIFFYNSSHFSPHIFRTFFMVFILGFQISCASRQVKEAKMVAHEIYERQRPVQVQSSADDNRPEWTKMIMAEEDGKIFFTGAFLNGSDYPVSVRCAYAEALKAVAQSISQFVRMEFSEFVQGSNSGVDGVERWVSDGLAAYVKNLHLQGVKPREVYYEEKFSPILMTATFDVFLRLEILRADYLSAKAEALKHLRDRFSREGKLEAKKKAEQLLESLKSELQDV